MRPHTHTPFTRVVAASPAESCFLAASLAESRFLVVRTRR